MAFAVSETSTRHLFQIRDNRTCGADAPYEYLCFTDNTMNSGTVKFYNGTKGFGFIQPTNGGQDVFVHATALERAGINGLAEGQQVEFDLERDQRGRNSASNLRLL
jgi:CspA family cold shock protein